MMNCYNNGPWTRGPDHLRAPLMPGPCGMMTDDTHSMGNWVSAMHINNAHLIIL